MDKQSRKSKNSHPGHHKHKSTGGKNDSGHQHQHTSTPYDLRGSFFPTLAKPFDDDPSTQGANTYPYPNLDIPGGSFNALPGAPDAWNPYQVGTRSWDAERPWSNPPPSAHSPQSQITRQEPANNAYGNDSPLSRWQAQSVADGPYHATRSASANPAPTPQVGAGFRSRSRDGAPSDWSHKAVHASKSSKSGRKRSTKGARDGNEYRA